MQRIIIEGGKQLEGQLSVSGSKNAVLPLMVASLLTDAPLVLTDVPDLADTRTLSKVLTFLGADIVFEGGQMTLATHNISTTRAPYELVAQMRASFWVIGPLLARMRTAEVSLPGGCAIGTRPVNFYLQGLAAMGAEIDVENGYVKARAPRGLHGAQLTLPVVSVGATHVLMMAATHAEGVTIIDNAALEPEIVELGQCLQKMGAHIEGLGTRCITVIGGASLGGTTWRVSPDRIEAGALAMALIITGGHGRLHNARRKTLGVVADVLANTGAVLKDDLSESTDPFGSTLEVQAGEHLLPKSITTGAYPAFATDLQAPFMALMCLAEGTSYIRETVFENRFMHVQELIRLGANIELVGDTALVHGVPMLKGAPVMATDLRASISLVLAALAATETSIINRVYHLDRGFERLEEKLASVGAQIHREDAP